MSSAAVHATPILLTDASHYGTLAAVRCIGRSGVPVTIADSRKLGPSKWSRYVTRRVPCPGIDDGDRFIEWLLAFGRREPRHVLYPTSDDVAWLYALHHDALAEHFDMFQPGAEPMYRLLNKRALFDACHAVGVQAPVSYFPDAERDLDAIAAAAAFPLLLKPATQVMLRPPGKGVTVHDAGSLRDAYRAFRSKHTVPPDLATRFPGADRPMLQAFHPEAARGIHSVSGFIDRSGTRIVAVAARKILQRPRKLGIGLCFEEAPARPELVAGLAALCREVGYHGVFEAEFIEADGRHLLIDFNPRFYSQMAFECGRGLHLPRMAYEAALGRDDVFAAASTREWPVRGHVYTHRLLLELITRGQRLTGRMTRGETAGWRRWRRTHRGRLHDAVQDRGDIMPAVVDFAAIVVGYSRHPRSFVRAMLLDR